MQESNKICDAKPKFAKLEAIRLKIPTSEELARKEVTEYDEVDKMVSSLPFTWTFRPLDNGAAYARVMCQKLNYADPLDENLQYEILNEMLGTFSSIAKIIPPFKCEFGSNVHLDEGVFINSNCTFIDGAEIRIGRNTQLGPGVQLYTAGHSMDPTQRHIITRLPIRIGQNCWIGGSSIILRGVTIGDGVTIGAGSVVTKDIESYSVAVGVPARVIKKIEPSNK